MLRPCNVWLFMVTALVFIQVTGFSQQHPLEISVNPPQVVNFQQLADWELANPTPMVQHVVKQEEDLDRDFNIEPRPIPSNAQVFHVSLTVPDNTEVNSSPLPSTTFNGIISNGSVNPPDIRGAVGPTSILETTNQQFSIFSKTGTLLKTLGINTFFSSTGGRGFFDPHCMYDVNYGRFIISMDGLTSNDAGGIFLAVSQTDDPTGDWYVYSFQGVTKSTDFLDYPLLGYNTSWVVVTANQLVNGGNPVYSRIFVMNRSDLYAGILGAVGVFTDRSAYCLDPAQSYGKVDTIEYLVQDHNGSSGGFGYMKIAAITGPATAPVYTTGSVIGIDQPWSETPMNATQKGSTETIDIDDTRVSNTIFSKGMLWFTHTVFLPVSKPAFSGVDWWEVNPSSMSVKQYDRVSTAINSTFYYYPSIAVNACGDMLLGYCQSSASTYPSAAYAFRGEANVINTIGASCIYKAGLVSYYDTAVSERNRWGDYSGTSVDPADSSFWVFGQWSDAIKKWGTSIAHVPASCNVLPSSVPEQAEVTAVIENLARGNASSSTLNNPAATDLIEASAVLENIQIYPNPAQDKITVQFTSSVGSDATMSIYNLDGQRVVSTNKLIVAGFNTENLETGNLSDGLYLLEIGTSGAVIRQKIVIAR